MMRVATYLLAGTLTLGASTPAASQSSNHPGEVQFRNDCRLAAQILQAGHPANKTGWAIDMLGACREEGPSALAQMWSRTALDSATARDLLGASIRIRDWRIAAAALAVAQSPSQQETVRITAMTLLFLYADPRSSVSIQALVPPPGWTPGQNTRTFPIDSRLHTIPQADGEEPLSSGIIPETAAALRTLAGSDPSPRIQYVATGFARRLEHRAASH